ncbi:hypothetical protein DF3PB_3500002 [uncultured Defluviicoccus sp.]|uniref:Uncharacterized protein n=1 Tax=metagenome TaxID=256318 RepID=A0A380TER2_9ZZZZ|nr:hypothetical protein DF3PB_3500002 [uncultured Defluviicoccus sp.]
MPEEMSALKNYMRVSLDLATLAILPVP